MNLRVTPLTSLSQSIRTAQLHSSNVRELQLQASTGIRIHRPSDDPQAVRRLLAHKLDDARFDVHLANINEARLVLNNSVSTLLEANSLLVRARDIALAANQSQSRDILAQEVDLLIDRLVDLANAESNGNFLFGGSGMIQKPFVEAPDAATPYANPVSYQGSAEASSVLVAAEITVDPWLPGDLVFQPRDRGETLIVGQSGAAAGPGTDTAVGIASLTIRHTGTTYGGGSGIQPGSDSVSGDTILGASHTLVVNDTSGTGASGTVSLNGGEAVDFTAADTNLRVPGANGEVVYVDTTAITAGFSGSVSILADGTLSVDGGLSEIPIDFSNSQAVVDSRTQAVTYVDSSAIRTAGVDTIEYVGTSGVFRALAELRDDLLNERELGSEDWSESIARRLTDIDRLRDHVLSVVGDRSLLLEDLDILERRVQDQQLASREAISNLESADISEVAIRLQVSQDLLQFTFATTASVLDQSLLDFLR